MDRNKCASPISSVRVEEVDAMRAESILDGAGGVTAATRGTAWRGEGWDGRFDETLSGPASGSTGMGLR